jgi:hypothetical protein
LKGVETVEDGSGIGTGDESERGMTVNEGLVCVDIDAVEDGEMVVGVV